MKRLLIAAFALLGLGASAEIYKSTDTGECIEPVITAQNVCVFIFCRNVETTALIDVACPDVEPPAPDADGDGIPDEFDECPTDPTNTCNEPPPPVDSDGDGVPDSEDECPNDPTNTCNEPPPPPPPSGGSYRGIPEEPDFSRSPGPATIISGAISSLSGGHFTCNGGVVKAQSKNQISLGSDTVVSDCVLNGDRFIGQGNNIAVLDSEINFPPKVGVSLSGTNLVVRGNRIVGSGAGGSTERHGINAGCGSDGVWVLENELVGNSGDGFQSGHKCDASPLTNVYVGGNHAEDNRENAYDTKRVVGYVLSGNTASGHTAAGKGETWCFQGRCGNFNSGSDGAPIVIGSDGSSDQVEIYDNTLSGNSKGIRIEESFGTRIEGNAVTGASIAIEFEKHGGANVVNGVNQGLFIEINDNNLGGGSIRSRFRSQNFCARGTGNTNFTLDMKNDTLRCSDIN